MTAASLVILLVILLLGLLVIGSVCLLGYVTVIRFKTLHGTPTPADLVWGAIALAIWLPICAGVLVVVTGRPLADLLQHPVRPLLSFAVSGYAILLFAFVLRRGLREIPAAYREGKRQRAEARGSTHRSHVEK